jgi:hypothetical protein
VQDAAKVCTRALDEFIACCLRCLVLDLFFRARRSGSYTGLYPLPTTCPPCKTCPTPLLRACTTNPPLPKVHPRLHSVQLQPYAIRKLLPPHTRRSILRPPQPPRAHKPQQTTAPLVTSQHSTDPSWSALVESPLVRLDRELHKFTHADPEPASTTASALSTPTRTPHTAQSQRASNHAKR